VNNGKKVRKKKKIKKFFSRQKSNGKWGRTLHSRINHILTITRLTLETLKLFKCYDLT